MLAWLMMNSIHPQGGAKAQEDCEYLSSTRPSFLQSEAEPVLYGLMRQLGSTLTSRHGPRNISFDWEAQDFRKRTGWHDLKAHIELSSGRWKCYAL